MQQLIDKLATDYSNCNDICIRHDLQGTNGGVTWTGLAASIAGGLFMGLVFWSMGAISPRLYTVPFQQEPALGQWSLVMLGTAHYTNCQSNSVCCHASVVTCYRCSHAHDAMIKRGLKALFVRLQTCSSLTSMHTDCMHGMAWCG